MSTDSAVSIAVIVSGAFNYVLGIWVGKHSERKRKT